MNTQDLYWYQRMHKKDTVKSTENVEGEQIYTVMLADFLRMPDVNFNDVACIDEHVRSLLN